MQDGGGADLQRGRWPQTPGYVCTLLHPYFPVANSPIERFGNVLSCTISARGFCLQPTLCNKQHSDRLSTACLPSHRDLELTAALTGSGAICCHLIRKLEKAVTVLGSLREFLRKVPGKFRENCWKMFPNREMLQILGLTGKANLLQTLGPHFPGPCADLSCGVFFEIDSYSLLEFF